DLRRDTVDQGPRQPRPNVPREHAGLGNRSSRPGTRAESRPGPQVGRSPGKSTVEPRQMAGCRRRRQCRWRSLACSRRGRCARGLRARPVHGRAHLLPHTYSEMRSCPMNMRSLLLAGVALSMAACVAAPAAAPPPTAVPPATRVPIAQPTVVVVAKPTQPPVAAAPTATFERVAEQEPRVAAPQPHGLVTWRDDTLRNDSPLVSAEDLPTLPRGQVYAAWLAGEDNSVFLGTLAPGAGGAKVLSYTATDHANLLGDFDRLTISRVSPTESGQPSTNAVLEGGLPAQALIHMRHVLVGIPSTPNGTGFVLGLRDQTEEMLRHAQFLQEAQVEGNLASEKLHAEHLVNLIEGQHGEHYGDLNGNGKVDDPGDGYGVLPNGADDSFSYMNGMREHAQLAANAPDSTPEIKLHAGHVQIAADNTQVRTTEIRDGALELLKTRSASDTRSDVQKVLALAQQTIVGLDLNGDE